MSEIRTAGDRKHQRQQQRQQGEERQHPLGEDERRAKTMASAVYLLGDWNGKKVSCVYEAGECTPSDNAS